MKNKKKPRPLLIEWVDSATFPQGWLFEDDLNFHIHLCTSVGFVIKENKKRIVLAPHIFFKTKHREESSMTGLILIPISAIRSRKQL